MKNLLSALSVLLQARTNNDKLAIVFWVILAILFVVIVVVGIKIFINGNKRQIQYEQFFSNQLDVLKSMDRHCNFCGQVVEDDAVICPNCGANLVNNERKNKQ